MSCPYRPRLSWLLAAGSAALTACTTLAPDYERPTNPVSGYAVPAGPEGTSATLVDTGWRAYFTDPQLRDVIAQALENNRDLRVAILRVEEAQAAYGITRADRFPTLGAAAAETRGRTPGDLSPTGRSVVSSQFEVGLNVPAWELDFWGRLRSLRESALQDFLATDSARQAATISLIAQVADAYLVLRELDERLALASHSVENYGESLRIFRRRYEVGAVSRLEVAQVESLLAQARALEAQLARSRAAQLNALNLLAGAPVETLPRDTRLDDRSVMEELRVGLPSEVLLQRPDIVAAEHRLRAANANIGAARAAFFPRVTLTGSYGTASAELEGLFEGGSESWGFSPSISLPIFDAGRRQANLDLAEVRKNIAVASYEKTVQTAFREVADALVARHWLSDLVDIRMQTREAQAERARLAKLRYEAGATPYLEVLDAELALLSSDQQLVETRRALLSSRVQLYAALGGGAQGLDATPIQ